jgi:hypothetical protein
MRVLGVFILLVLSFSACKKEENPNALSPQTEEIENFILTGDSTLGNSEITVLKDVWITTGLDGMVRYDIDLNNDGSVDVGIRAGAIEILDYNFYVARDSFPDYCEDTSEIPYGDYTESFEIGQRIDYRIIWSSLRWSRFSFANTDDNWKLIGYNLPSPNFYIAIRDDTQFKPRYYWILLDHEKLDSIPPGSFPLLQVKQIARGI